MPFVEVKAIAFFFLNDARQEQVYEEDGPAGFAKGGLEILVISCHFQYVRNGEAGVMVLGSVISCIYCNFHFFFLFAFLCHSCRSQGQTGNAIQRGV